MTNIFSHINKYFFSWVKVLTLLLGFFPFLSETFAQAPNFYKLHFKIDEQTSATAIHQIIEDSIGFVWLATDKGIIRFDAVNYEQYDMSHVVPSNEFFGITKDDHGVLWFFSADRLLVRYNYQTDSFEEHELNPCISRLDVGVINRIYWSHDTALVQFDGSKVYKVFKAKDNTSADCYLEDFSYLRFPLALKFNNRLAVTDMRASDDSEYYFLGDKLLWVQSMNAKRNYTKRTVFLSDSFSWVASNGSLVGINQAGEKVEHVDFSYHNTPAGLLVDDSLYAWLGYFDDGFECIKLKAQAKTRMLALQGETVTSFFQNSEGNIWISTLKNGFFLVKSPTFEKHYFPNQPILFVEKLDPYEIIFLKNGEIYAKKQDEDEFVLIDNVLFEPINKRLLNNQLVVSSTKAHFYASVVDEILVHKVEIKGSPKKHLVASSTGSFLKIFTDIFKPNLLFIELENSEAEVYLNEQIMIKESIANGKGDVFISSFIDRHCFLKRIDDNFQKQDYLGITHHLNRIRQSQFLTDDMIRFVDYRGIFDWSISNPDCFDTIFSSDDFDLKRFQEIKNKGYLGTTIGLQTISNVDSASLKYLVSKNYNSLVVNDFVVSNQSIGLATDDGFYQLSVNDSFQHHPLIVYDVRNADGQRFNPNEEVLPFENGKIQIFWSDFDYANGLRRKYRWRLSQNDKWTKSNSNSVSLSSIGYGKYQFEVQQLNVNGKWSESAYQFFEVDKPYYLKLPFILLVSLLISGLVTFGVYLRLRAVNERFRLKEGLFEAQSQALSAQLNPHFIFNSMNTVSSFIAQEDDTKALRYISKLSVLLRRIFANSQLASISLGEELQSVKEYVEIEQLRFGKKLKFHFENKTEADLDVIQTPAMLIQPFVENAIKHAVLKSENGGNIWLTVTETPKNICVTIEDDGPGFTEQDLLARANQGSSSISAIQKRLDIMKFMKQESATLSVEHGEKGAKIKLSFIKPNR
ncbi:MAG: histidine kinase [Salibacteraceae bacterium]|nr:histidine kinase [Salibacteraceae bacterium]